MASVSVPCPKTTLVAGAGSNSTNLKHNQRAIVPFVRASLLNPSPSLSFGLSLTGSQWSNKKQSAVIVAKAQTKEVTAEKSSNSALISNESKVASSKSEEERRVPDAASISAFMSQALDLIKLVDSRDIVELQLKQSDCELVIRKKEALQQAQGGAPVYVQPPHATFSSPPPPAPAAAPAPASSAPSPPPALPAPAKTSSSSHPPMKCPMAGNFYRSPAPGEPPFVKVGDKVQKGQVVCIIEAMKLMNEIEADQSGTITEIVAEDGKPVSVDSPLFVITP